MAPLILIASLKDLSLWLPCEVLGFSTSTQEFGGNTTQHLIGKGGGREGVKKGGRKRERKGGRRERS
jgi:hypothetical protein